MKDGKEKDKGGQHTRLNDRGGRLEDVGKGGEDNEGEDKRGV